MMSDLIPCPFCQHTDGQTKAGFHNGAQRFRCTYCMRRYTPSQPRGYSTEMRKQALELRATGMGIRQIAREMNVNPNSVINWLRAAKPAEDEPKVAEKEEVKKKQAAPGGMRRSTIVDVAKAAGVSIATVSNYLNDKVNARSATRKRIETAMADLHFTPNSLIRAIRRGRTNIIGVAMYWQLASNTEYANGIAASLLSGITVGADNHQLNILQYTGWRHHNNRGGLEFLDGQIDGLIRSGPKLVTPELEEVCKAGLPVMALLGRSVPKEAGYVAAAILGGCVLAILLH
jgi:transposase-like protein/transcriptional regulator with XRE-family HTH domain